MFFLSKARILELGKSFSFGTLQQSKDVSKAKSPPKAVHHRVGPTGKKQYEYLDEGKEAAGPRLRDRIRKVKLRALGKANLEDQKDEEAEEES